MGKFVFTTVIIVYCKS